VGVHVKSREGGLVYFTSVKCKYSKLVARSGRHELAQTTTIAALIRSPPPTLDTVTVRPARSDTVTVRSLSFCNHMTYDL
jgi:hypothetical protein